MTRYFIRGKEATIAQAMRHLGENNFYKKLKEACAYILQDNQCESFSWPAENFEIKWGGRK